MNVQRKIEKWCRDERFVRYVSKRTNEEFCKVRESNWFDPGYEELDEAFERDDRYIEPLATYLTYRLQVAKLQKDAKKRRCGIWWVFVQVSMQGHYTQIFSGEFEKLQTELVETIMPMLHDEYMQKLNKKNCKGTWSSNI
ncbi:hypothetical protein [Bacteroides sp. 14(A)]|uniref:hypothetical protein n=1 Tax=Bacteroides sp. 14(A) TaxID=1163670 RepID=UPI00047852F7|nr:hypothetical protein [Bacteroides sp. 14(A)]